MQVSSLFRHFFDKFDEFFVFVAFLVLLEEEFAEDFAVFVEDVGAGVRNTGQVVGTEGFSVHHFVADAEGVDGFAAFVGQQGVFD